MGLGIFRVRLRIIREAVVTFFRGGVDIFWGGVAIFWGGVEIFSGGVEIFSEGLRLYSGGGLRFFSGTGGLRNIKGG